ncbi:hypothetical protein BN1708_019906, partial [Verticillium longisporum]
PAPLRRPHRLDRPQRRRPLCRVAGQPPRHVGPHHRHAQGPARQARGPRHPRHLAPHYRPDWHVQLHRPVRGPGPAAARRRPRLHDQERPHQHGRPQHEEYRLLCRGCR